MKLKDFLSSDRGLSDLLLYAHIVDDGVIMNKDGAFLTTFKFRGPDIYSASQGELDALTANFNRMTTFLEDGWMLHCDELRIPSLTYPEKCIFPDSVSALIDDERRDFYEEEGAHFENFQFLTFVWKFPLPVVKTTRHWFVEGIEKEDDNKNLTKLLESFKRIVENCTNLLSSQLHLEQLNNHDLLSYLNTCITGELLPVTPPPEGCFIDVVLGRQNVTGGYVPQIGKKHVYALTLVGYLNNETIPGLLDEMGTYSMVYRWSNRFIPMSETTAEREIKRYQMNWSNKVKGFKGLLREVITGKETNKINEDAVQMKNQTTDALTINSNHSSRFGYWTSTVILMHEDIERLNQATKDITRYLQQAGFNCVQEDVNAFDAWLGSIPGHGSANVKRLFIHAINLAHALPLHSIWSGPQKISSSSKLPPNAPPTFYAATTGDTPFRFYTDVSDVGHMTIIGPTGAGKSTLLGFLIAQFRRYPKAKAHIFDIDFSHMAETMALGGNHYNIGIDPLSFCPLADLSTESKRIRAEQFIEDLVILQNVEMSPSIRQSIHLAMTSLASESNYGKRDLTVFSSVVQNQEVREALYYYTLQGQMHLLDAREDSLKNGSLQTYEMKWLLNQKPEIYVPVLRHIFDQIESQLEDANATEPTLIILEEAWLYTKHPAFAPKIRDWLKTLRKKNGRVVFVSQSLSDLYDPQSKTLSEVTSAIMESCPTKIYLPNPKMERESISLYEKMGLSARQIEIIGHVAIPKRHYYVVTPEGNRLIDLGFSEFRSLALSFILPAERRFELKECQEQHGEAWVYHWLIKENFEEWADYWKQTYYQREVAR